MSEMAYWKRSLRALTFPYWVFRGADVEPGGRFHRWVWGRVNHPLEGR
jgi:hypothetical protein